VLQNDLLEQAVEERVVVISDANEAVTSPQALADIVELLAVSSSWLLGRVDFDVRLARAGVVIGQVRNPAVHRIGLVMTLEVVGAGFAAELRELVFKFCDFLVVTGFAVVAAEEVEHYVIRLSTDT